MARLQGVVFFLMIASVTGGPPTFQCLYSGTPPNCGPSFLFKDMNYERIDEMDPDYSYQLEAEDPDGDDVTFSIIAYLGTLDEFQADGLEFLEVNGTTGWVRPKQDIDYETIHALKIRWKLTDTNGEFYERNIEVAVNNINDNDPEFSSIRYQTEPVPENSRTPEDVIFTVSATDDDSAEGLVYSTVPNHKDWPCNGDIFEIDGTSGNITLKMNAKLDFEATTLYTICVCVGDSGEPEGDERDGYAQVIVAIQDAQDTAPTFTSSNYDTEIKENAEKGYAVVTVQAKEGDRGVLVPNEIIYTLTGGDGKFQIGNKTGLITIKETLDRETNSSHTVRVEAQEITSEGNPEERPSSTAVNITFQVADVDDEYPEFNSHFRSIKLPENSLGGSFVDLEDLQVFDKDQAPNNEIHLSLGGRDADAFRMQSETIISQGIIDVRVQNQTKLDYEKYTTLQFQIYAKDKEGMQCDTANISVTLEDQNDETPVFTEDSYVFEVDENSEGTWVGVISATDADSPPHNTVTYELFGQGDNPQFKMGSMSGEIRVEQNATLDREGQSVYIFTCVASDGQRSATKIVQIDLLDINDIPPEFTASIYNVQQDEAQVPTEPILTVLANDGDTDEENKAITYSLQPCAMSTRFDIHNTTGDIYLIKELDYETEGPKFELTVTATDGGKPPLTTNATISVTIQDVNDNHPKFTQTFFEGNVSETAERKEFVLEVKATDDDKEDSVNSRIDYFFEDDEVSDFRIGISTGQITVNSAFLDHDVQSIYTLAVIAIDRGEPELNGTCVVEIQILDVNNKPPVFNSSLLIDSVYENATSGSSVAMVTASDPDQTAQLVYSINKEGIEAMRPDGTDYVGSLKGMFRIDNTSGEIFIRDTPLNREEISMFTIPVTVEDIATEITFTATAEDFLTLFVLDVNDNAPMFSELEYRFTVRENTAPDSVISTRISASDDDEGSNSLVTFELAEDVDSLLAIDPETGELTVQEIFDYEEYSTYTVLVVAHDDGHPQLSSNQTIVIDVEDVNDNSPDFNVSQISMEVLENKTSEVNLLQVKAWDNDGTPEFSNITYAITGGDPNELFFFDKESGWITIREGKKLDRETEETHILTVSASDEGGRQDTVEVIITVLDVNDNAPDFPVYSRTISIPESVEINHLVTTVTATDKDEVNTNNSRVIFSIVDGNEDGFFRIDNINEEGLVRTDVSLSNQAYDHLLRITASDLGNPSLESSTLNLTITVTDVNDNTPEIEYPTDLQDIPIAENYTGSVLFVLATDTDGGDNGILDFTFIRSVGSDGRDDEYFNITKIDGEKGKAEITIREVTDRERKAIYYLEVQVTDRGLSPLNARVSFTVSVTDSDDNDPVFWTDSSDRSPVSFSVPENNDMIVVGSVDRATDADEPQNQEFNYFIVGGNSGGEFALEQKTGKLSLIKPLDRELVQFLDLVVKVESNGTIPTNRSLPYNKEDNTMLQVNVTVSDQNDNGPRFKKSLYTGGAKYNAEFDSEVIVVEAVDEDIDNNAIVLYNRLSELYIPTDGGDTIETENFKVDADTGSVRTIRNFDRQDVGYFTLQVQAVDSLDFSFTDEATVSIYLFSEEQQVSMTIFKTTDAVRDYMEDFQSLIEDIIKDYGVIPSASKKRATEVIDPAFVQDELQVLTIDNKPVIGWSVLKFHVVNRMDNTIIAPSVVVNAIDDAYEYTEDLRSLYGVDDIQIAVPPTLPPPTLDWVQWLLLAFLCVSVVFVVGLLAVYCIMSSSYKRKLRAATAGVYETKIPSSVATNLAPNTNKFTEPGSNPLFGSKLSPSVEADYSEIADSVETAKENGEAVPVKLDDTERSSGSNSFREEQELVLEMFDDSADHEQVRDDDTGDLLITKLLQDVERKRKGEMLHLAEFSNLTITEI